MPKISCPSCRKALTVTRRHVGRRVKCPTCDTPFVVDAGDVVPDPPKAKPVGVYTRANSSPPGTVPAWVWPIASPLVVMFLCCGGCAFMARDPAPAPVQPVAVQPADGLAHAEALRRDQERIERERAGGEVERRLEAEAAALAERRSREQAMREAEAAIIARAAAAAAPPPVEEPEPETKPAVTVAAARSIDDPPQPFYGDVVSIADGDTITVLTSDKHQHRVRLNGLDAPEHKQSFGLRAKMALGDKVFRKRVRVEWKERDKYGRIIGDIYVTDRNVNVDMVQEGWAWHYKEYSSDPVLAAAETTARAAKRGLWADTATPIPPWDYRHNPPMATPTPEPVARSGIVAAEPPARAPPRSRLGGFAGRQPQAPQAMGQTVYITRTGEKYHTAGCRHLSKSAIPISLDDAISRGYGPCSHCH